MVSTSWIEIPLHGKLYFSKEVNFTAPRLIQDVCFGHTDLNLSFRLMQNKLISSPIRFKPALCTMGLCRNQQISLNNIFSSKSVSESVKFRFLLHFLFQNSKIYFLNIFIWSFLVSSHCVMTFE